MLQPRKDKKVGKRANGDSYDQVYIKDGKKGMVNPATGTFSKFMKRSIQNPYDNNMDSGYNPRNADAYIKNVKYSNPNFKVQPVNLPREDQADVSKFAGVSRSTVLGRLPGNKKEKTINKFTSTIRPKRVNKTITKPGSKKVNNTVTNPGSKRVNKTITNPGSGLSPVNGNAFTGAKAVTRMNDDGKGKKIKNEVARDTTISGRSMNEGMARKMFNHNFRKFNPGGDVPKANLTQEKNKGGQMQYVYSATVGTSPTEMNSPAAYGTGSPFQLRKEKLSGSERKNKEEGIDTSSDSNKKRFAEYKEKGGKLTTTQAARIGYASPKESKSRRYTAAQDHGRGNLEN